MYRVQDNKKFMDVLNSLKLQVDGLHDWKILETSSTGKADPEIIFIFLIKDVKIHCILTGKPLNKLLHDDLNRAAPVVTGSIKPDNIIAWLKYHYFGKLFEEEATEPKSDSHSWYHKSQEDMHEAFFNADFFNRRGYSKKHEPKSENFDGEDFFRTFHSKPRATKAGEEFEDFINSQRRATEERERRKNKEYSNNNTSFASRGGLDKTKAYSILGIKGFNTGPADIKKAYREKAREWHPDRNSHRVEESIIKM